MEYTKTFIVNYRNEAGYKPYYHKRAFTIKIQTDELGFYTNSTYKQILEALTDCARKQEKTDKVTIVWYQLQRS